MQRLLGHGYLKGEAIKTKIKPAHLSAGAFAVMGGMLSLSLYVFYIEVVYPSYAYLYYPALAKDIHEAAFFSGALNGLAFRYFVRTTVDIDSIFLSMYFLIVVFSATVFFIGSDNAAISVVSSIALLYLYPAVSKVGGSVKVALPTVPLYGAINIATVSLLALVILAYDIKFSLISVTSFADLYDYRMHYREESSAATRSARYALMILAKALLPFLFALALVRREKSLSLVSIALFLVIFFVSAHKSILLSPVLILGVYITSVTKLNLRLWTIAAAWFATLLALFTDGVMQVLFGDMLVRRVMLVPGMLTSVHFTYFSENGFQLFSSIASKFTGVDFDPIAFIIGKEVFGNEALAANANFVASGYAEGGTFGVVVYAIIITIALKLLGSGTQEHRQVFMLASVPVLWAFLETNLVTVILTHGLLALIFIKLFWRARA